jgi:hypothetical protein
MIALPSADALHCGCLERARKSSFLIDFIFGKTGFVERYLYQSTQV